MNKEKIGQFGKIFMYIFPAILGFCGMVRADQGGFLECAYKTVQLYLVEFAVEGDVMNWQLEWARWLAPLATVAFILSFLYSVVENMKIWFLTKVTDLIAIHGNSTNIDLVLKNLGSRAIHSDKIMAFRARRHVLMFDDDFDMYRFLDEHGSHLLDDPDKEVFLCSEKILRGSYENKQLVVCNVAENCARDYWKKHPLIHEKEKILIIGFENYGQRLLTQAVLKNVVSTDSQIEYHVAGDYHTYLAKHNRLHKAVHVKKVKEIGQAKDFKPYDPICDNHDMVFFYDVPWCEVLNQDIKFDRIILAYDTDAQNLDVLNELKSYYVNPVCYIKFTDTKVLKALWDLEKENIIPYGIDEELYEPEVILKERLFDHAKMIHARYFAKWQCDGNCDGKSCGNKEGDEVKNLKICAHCPRLLVDWNKQSTFIRYSNVAQADHMEEKLRLLLGVEDGAVLLDKAGIGKEACDAYEKLSYDEQKNLWQIEHIRWNRYHFMNNWDYNEKRDNPNRKHHLLVPFESLSRIEQEKDADAYLALDEILI